MPLSAAILRRRIRSPLGSQSGGGVVVPVAPVFTAPVNQEIITEDVAYTVTVTSTGDTAVSLYDGVSLIGAMTDAGGGVWTYSWTPTSPDYDVQLNAVGDVSGQGETLTIVVAEANLISQNFSTGWSKTRVTVTGSQTDPDGGSTAYRAVMGNNAATTFTINNTSAVAAPSVAASGFEIWAKPDGVTKMFIYPLEDGAQNYAHIDLVNKYTRTNRCYCKIVEERGGWYRIWFNYFESAGAGPRNFYIYFCSTFGSHASATFTGTEAIYLWKPRTAQNGTLPLTIYQKLAIEYVSTASGQERWDFTHPYVNSVSDVGLNKYRIDVIKPSGWANTGDYTGVYALPALSRASEPGTDVASTFVSGDYANTYDCVIIVPYDKSGTNWYGEKNDGTYNTHAFTALVLTSFAREFLGVSTERNNNLLVGYSKSANGGLSLMLRNPTKFGAGAFWDGAWTQNWTFVNGNGGNLNFGTEAQWQLYNPNDILTSYLSSVNDKTRIALLGYYTFGADLTAFKATLDANSVPYDYDSTLRGSHAYNAGWLSDAMSRLFAIQGNL